MNRGFVLLLLVTLLLSACQPITRPPAPEPQPLQGIRPDAPAYAVHGPYAVGTREFVMETTERSIPVTVWYPALNPTGAEETIAYSMDVGDAGLPPFPVAGHALLDAPPDLSGAPYPLVVFSHGAFAFRQMGAYITEHLASQGFVVMAANHEDNWGTFPASYATSIVSRPADISREIDLAETLTAAGGALEGAIDAGKVGVIGNSYGTYAALAAAGARMDWDWFLNTWCAKHPGDATDSLNDCVVIAAGKAEIAALAGLDSVPEGLWPSMGDPRVDAVVLTAPMAEMHGPKGVASLTMPAMIIGGSLDTMVDPELDTRGTYENWGSADKTLVMFENAWHAIINSRCADVPGLVDVGWYFFCSDLVWDMDRAHDLVNHFATAFLLAELKGDAAAASALAPENVSFPGIQYETTGFAK